MSKSVIVAAVGGALFGTGLFDLLVFGHIPMIFNVGMMILGVLLYVVSLWQGEREARQSEEELRRLVRYWSLEQLLKQVNKDKPD